MRRVHSLVKTTGISGQNQNPCALILGSGKPCYSAQNNAIQGATYVLTTECLSAKERRDEASEATECQEPNLIGYQENGVSYQLHKNGTAHAELMASQAVNDESAMGDFIKQRAERVVQ